VVLLGSESGVLRLASSIGAQFLQKSAVSEASGGNGGVPRFMLRRGSVVDALANATAEVCVCMRVCV